jgi:hypothetical protein
MEEIMTEEQKSAEYYRLAYQCAESKKHGCKGYCGNCSLNVSLYLADQREAVLVKTSAALDNDKTHSDARVKAWSNFIAFLFVVGLCLGLFWKCSVKAQEPPRSVPFTEVYNAPRVPIGVARNAEAWARLNMYDVNKDGKINCIDYAILFKVYVGPRARIIRNVNPRTGMNHLF